MRHARVRRARAGRRRRPRRPDGGRRAGPPRASTSLLVERRPRALGLPRATVVSTRSMELFRSWGLEDEVRAGGVDVEWLMLDLRARSPTSAGRHGDPDRACRRREQSAVLSPTAPGLRPAGPPRAGAARHLARRRAARVELGAEVDRRRAPAPTACGRRCATSRRATVREVRARYLIAADGAHSRGPDGARASRCTGPTGSREAVSARCSARRSGTLLGEHRYGIYDDRPSRGRAACSCPPGRATAGCTASSGSPASERPASSTERAVRRADPAGGGRARPAAADRAHRAVHLRRPARRAVPAGQRVPRRRRGPPGDAARRHRDEHRDPRRLRPGLEARLGAARLGAADAARLLRVRAAAGRRAQRRAVGRSRSARGATSSGELHADLGGRIPHVWVPHGRRAGLDARPARPRATRCSPRRPTRRCTSRRRPAPRSPCAGSTRSSPGRSASPAAAR